MDEWGLPVFWVWTYIVLCVMDLSQTRVPECVGPGSQPDIDKSTILAYQTDLNAIHQFHDILM